MKKNMKSLKSMLAAALILLMALILTVPVLASQADGDAATPTAGTEQAAVPEETETGDADGSVRMKAIAAALVVGVVAAAGAISMGWAITKSADGIARQPEAEGKIRTMLMLGLVFIETAIIYALVVAILIIFVL